MQKREADFGIFFRHWLKAHPMGSCAFELKQTRSHRLPFSAVKEHQLEFLLAAKSNRGILYKIADDSRGIKPFDMFYFRNAEAYVVIKYPECFVMIEPKTFIFERDVLNTEQSLTAERARKIAKYSYSMNPLKRSSGVRLRP